MARDIEKVREKNRRYYANTQSIRVHQAKQLLGGVCVSCGATEELQFDHIDPTTKEFNIVKRACGVSRARFFREVAKCQLLCFPCHIIKTNCDRRGEEFKTPDPWDIQTKNDDFDKLWASI